MKEKVIQSGLKLQGLVVSAISSSKQMGSVASKCMPVLQVH